jgi:hypothetical protein
MEFHRRRTAVTSEAFETCILGDPEVSLNNRSNLTRDFETSGKIRAGAARPAPEDCVE